MKPIEKVAKKGIHDLILKVRETQHTPIGLQSSTGMDVINADFVVKELQALAGSIKAASLRTT